MCLWPNISRYRLGYNGAPIGNSTWLSNSYVPIDVNVVTWPYKVKVMIQICSYLETPSSNEIAYGESNGHVTEIQHCGQVEVVCTLRVLFLVTFTYVYLLFTLLIIYSLIIYVCVDRVHQEGHGWPIRQMSACFYLPITSSD